MKNNILAYTGRAFIRAIFRIDQTLMIVPLMFLSSACAQTQNGSEKELKNMKYPIEKTEHEWKELLTPVQFHVLREKGTERPYTGQYDKFFEKGLYSCAGCAQPLFISDTKFNSGCGWPSFFEPVSDSSIIEKQDLSYGMVRTEIICSRCGGHLGHVFNDGPKPTGLRYCVNSASLSFKPIE